MRVKPQFGNREYDSTKMVYIKNPDQGVKYALHGAYVYDLIPYRDSENVCRFIYVFDKAEAAPLFEKWRNYELK